MICKRLSARVILLVTSIVMFNGCSGVPPINAVALNQVEKEKIVAAQNSLDEVLKTHSPFVYSELNSPASEKDLAELREHLGGIERPFLEIWFKWHNGGKSHPVGLLPLGGVFSIEEAIADRKMNQSIAILPASRKRDIKLLDDGAGDGYFLDLSGSSPTVYYEMLETPGRTNYGTMAQFITFITRVHEAGIASKNERGIIVFDDSTYNDIENEYLNSLNN